MARRAHQRVRALVLGPPHVRLRVEAEHIRGPQLLLALWPPALDPSEVAALRSDVRVVLRGDGAGLPAVPLANASPGRRPGVGDEHALAHDHLHDAPRQENAPPNEHYEEHGAGVVPWGHVDVRHRIILQDVRITILLLLFELLLGLGRCDKIGADLHGPREPRRHFARSGLVEQAASGLPGLVAGLDARRLRHRVEAEGLTDVHDENHDSNGPGDIDHGIVPGVCVLQGERNVHDERPTHLDREGTTLLGQHIHAEHEPDPRSETSGAQHRTPDHAELGNVVERDPVGESLNKVQHRDEEADAIVGLGAPVLLLGLPDQLEVLERLRRAVLAVCARRRLGESLRSCQFLVDPCWVALGSSGYPEVVLEGVS
mmetsp:Transcript_130079/g.277869  ORF Transcript_130079/g.277869 Transcript_130079/m.277869 type:complete len:372 (-) Transcript_130079:787-1902(-)